MNNKKACKTKLEKSAQAALKLVKEFARDICPFLRNSADNVPTATCLQRADVIRPCYVCRSTQVLSKDQVQK